MSITQGNLYDLLLAQVYGRYGFPDDAMNVSGGGGDRNVTAAMIHGTVGRVGTVVRDQTGEDGTAWGEGGQRGRVKQTRWSEMCQSMEASMEREWRGVHHYII